MQLIQKALTFDDVLLVPAHSAILPRDVSLQTRLTRDITLNLPLLSAAMDTVTEGQMAIAMAREGGVGIIHKSLTPEQQAELDGVVEEIEIPDRLPYIVAIVDELETPKHIQKRFTVAN